MTAPTPRDDVDAAAAELLALQHTDHPLPGWDVTCSVCRLTPAEAFRLGYRAAIAAYRAAQDGGAEETLRDALRVHHPIMRSETGPFSGCRCGQVKLGQDVIAHVIGHLRAALAPQAPR